MQVVWFKRDLRIQDHPALAAACAAGPVVPLYIVEPALWLQPDMSHRHYAFLCEALESLKADLKQIGLSLVIKVGDAVNVLSDLHARHGINAVWSHQETWNMWTYERDKQVLAWCQRVGVTWHEPVQNGVVRRLDNRDGWAALWYRFMKQPVAAPPTNPSPVPVPTDDLPAPTRLGLHEDGCTHRQRGSRAEGLRLLNDFLYVSGEHYTKEMSSPVTAYDSCSRLSPHFAFGTLSIREVFHKASDRLEAIMALPPKQRGRWPSAIRSFLGRLRWHCHFIQKLEDEPRQEFDPLHSAYIGLREDAFNQAYFDAWATGRTGYPMVDACMRALTTTGWLNFRMRAMLMSFASQHLWLHWREPGLHLARLFTDYEPGIHYPQVQMQSGTTGINSIRIYNPIKQGQDQDPTGQFIRAWIPELRGLSDDDVHAPWRVPSQTGDYPAPIVDEATARKAASARLYQLRKSTDHREEAQTIVHKHGSRKRPARRRTSAQKPVPKQGELLL